MGIQRQGFELQTTFEWAVRDAFFPNKTPSHEPGGVDLGRVVMQQKERLFADASVQRYIRTGKQVNAGQRVMACPAE